MLLCAKSFNRKKFWEVVTILKFTENLQLISYDLLKDIPFKLLLVCMIVFANSWKFFNFVSQLAKWSAHKGYN